MPQRIPIVILAGRDSNPGNVPPGLDPEEMLTGFKGALRLPWGRCVVSELARRIELSNRFEPAILIGPRRVYESLVECEIVDCEGNLAKSLRLLLETVRSRFGESRPVAVITCDILPAPAELEQLLAAGYDAAPESVLWWQMVQADPEEMAAGRWKPSYQLRIDPASETLNLYPGHLVVFRLEGLRIDLLTRLLQLAYRSRNRAVHQRHYRILGRGIWTLLMHDLRNWLRFAPSCLCLQWPYSAVQMYLRWKRGKLTVAEFEDHACWDIVHRSFQTLPNGKAVVFTITPLRSFAKDIDTRAELEEACGLKPCDSA